MSHLLAIAIGPVQEFIAAARRTRDLWFGSYLLSEISKAVARSVKDSGGGLIFPHPDGGLAPKSDNRIANIVLAELSGTQPNEVAAKAKLAAHDCWRQFADDARDQVKDVIRKEMWDDQIDEVVEFYAAWVQHVDPKQYQVDRKRLMRLLNGRKSCRDFNQAQQGDGGLPKSSLDGQRATVLEGPRRGEKPSTYRNRWSKEVRRRLRVRTGEQLDVIGVVKRVGEGSKPYPSVARIAADPWVRGIVMKEGETVLDEFNQACGGLRDGVIHDLNSAVYPQFSNFPFEGTTLFRSRHHEWWEETEEDLEPDSRQVKRPDWYSAVDSRLRDLEAFAKDKGLGAEPSPYLAVLVADGDRIGHAISELESADDHLKFSRALAGFAVSAKAIVDKHQGTLVYAGGDDVLAFLPVDTCLTCARQLHDEFGIRLREFNEESPTLSIGIGVGHFMENLEDLLDYGRSAEAAAKRVAGKDTLAVHVHKRGGTPVKISGRWTDNFEEKLMTLARLILEQAISGRLATELRSMADVYRNWAGASRADAIMKDVLRLIKAKQSRGGRQYVAQIESLLKQEAAKADGLETLAGQLLVARQIAESLRQAGERPQRILEAAL